MKVLLIHALIFTGSLSLASQNLTSTDGHLTPGHDISDCPDLITLTGPTVKDLYQAKDIHLTDVVVFPIIEVMLISETQVDLHSEIEVPLGSTLTIDINDCPFQPDNEHDYRPSNIAQEKRIEH